MNIFFGSLFWGILLILWGSSLILKTFNINMPLAKIFIAVIIILFGIKLLIGDSKKVISTKPYKGSGASYYRSNSGGEYNMIFSGGTIDLSDIDANSKNMEITVVFGTAEVVLPNDLKYDIQPTTVFRATVLPEKGHYGVGESRYEIGSGESTPIRIESTCVFGRLEYTFKDRLGKTQPAADTEEVQNEF